MEIKFSFCQLLTIAFIVLKLIGVIAWSWFLVLLPMIIPIIITIILYTIKIIIALIKDY